MDRTTPNDLVNTEFEFEFENQKHLINASWATTTYNTMILTKYLGINVETIL